MNSRLRPHPIIAHMGINRGCSMVMETANEDIIESFLEVSENPGMSRTSQDTKFCNETGACMKGEITTREDIHSCHVSS